MSPSAEPVFPPRGERDYAAAAVETFPWPVVAGYEDVHRWMDQGQAVHAAWQLKDVWEGLLKFLATLAVADHLATAPADDPRTRKLLDQLLKKGGLTDGDWAKLMEIALKDPERFRDFQHEFEPPAYLARQVADFLRTHECGVVVLLGANGVPA